MSTTQRSALHDGLLWRACDGVYRALVVEACFLAVCAPGIALTAVLVPDPSNAPLFGAAALPLGPALAAALHSADRQLAGDDASPARTFWRGWRLNATDALRLWAPAVAVLVVLAVSAGAAGAAPAGQVVRGVLAATAAVLAVVTVTALVVATGFRFRTRDAARLAVHVLGRRPGTALGVVGSLVLAGALALTSLWLALAAASLWVLLLAMVTRGAVRLVAEEFTHHDEDDENTYEGER
ncbi:DUF624 domain-containing protein [Paenibacillus sp. TRM 82003]|uniref:DUF624 domain-containing protein n=1 Tax=Kineococcus sp. TRM81007 TaxID=2925831 RepID=UPI001F55D588|nr:DUF624 domain-containing protein [Kineococcus sp. TRM81007]MCI2237257.1 DUF624 domain-containing protein [Kineococcus sp. TRM81007]MCI3919316.1 DUF624 domain-containing protein [Paenibacillus sp. TRM 82003]